mmetsp:Transcript_54380/g.90226  ORF Transcript_54380/g.90226 Transcript_54380/m.90226 type:complete len:138 (+) Transcript_54380:38-451(+)
MRLPAAFLCFLSLTTGRMVGGWSPVGDITEPRLQHLAQFALQSLARACAESNAISCNKLAAATFQSVMEAHTQVVSGLNYEIMAQTSAGPVTLRIYEQSWTRTLQITEAIFEEATLPTVSLDAMAFEDSLAKVQGKK